MVALTATHKLTCTQVLEAGDNGTGRCQHARTIRFHDVASGRRFTAITFDVKYVFLITTRWYLHQCSISAALLERTLGWETFYSREESPNDTGAVAVVDGSTLNYRICN